MTDNDVWIEIKNSVVLDGQKYRLEYSLVKTGYFKVRALLDNWEVFEASNDNKRNKWVVSRLSHPQLDLDEIALYAEIYKDATDFCKMLQLLN